VRRLCTQQPTPPQWKDRLVKVRCPSELDVRTNARLRRSEP
jgi:hypothetical protein